MKIRYCFLLVALLLCSAAPALALLKTGDAAPDFSGRTLDGLPTKLSDFKGKALLVEMGTTWCPSCGELAQQIDERREELKAQEITYIAVFLADSADSIRAHLADNDLEPADMTIIDSGEARRNYSIFSIPRLLLIDENFEIVFDEMSMSGKELTRRINDQAGQP